MEWSRTLEIWNGTVPNNGINGIREWKDPEQWNKWDTGMEWSRTMEKMKIGNGAVSKSGIIGVRDRKDPEQ